MGFSNTYTMTSGCCHDGGDRANSINFVDDFRGEGSGVDDEDGSIFSFDDGGVVGE